MKDMNFKIHIGDILTNSSSKDEIIFKEKFSTFLPQVIDPGIETHIILQGMDDSTLLLIFKYIQAHIEHVCDKCGNIYKDTLHIGKKQVTCMFDGEKPDEEDDETLYFSSNEKVIDIERYIVQSLTLEDNFVHVCTACQKNVEEENI